MANYKRVYNVIPQNATESRAVEIFLEGWRRGKETVGGSYDDAGIGQLSDKTARLYDIPVNERQIYINWYSQNYPGTVVEFVGVIDDTLGSPVDLPSTLVYPPGWVDSNPIGTFYTFGAGYSAIHTGSDLNKNTPHWDADKLAPVYSIGNGVVTTASKLSGTWGNVVVVKHDGFYARYGHLDSITVAVGSNISKGQQLGRVGNAFGQLPYHLHLDISPTNVLQTNPAHWPGNNITTVVKNYVDPKSWILLSRQPTLPTKTVYMKNVGNFRTGPATNFPIYKSLSQGTKLTQLNILNDWHFVRSLDGEYGWVHYSLITNTPPATSNTLFGLHASADPTLAGGEVDAFKTARIDLIKALSNLDPNNVTQLVNARPSAKWIIRAFLSMQGRNISPSQFYNDTVGDVERTLGRLQGKDVVLELHNEPNLTTEGLGSSWNTGTEFNNWIQQVLQLYRSKFPNHKMMFPGLSPGDDILGLRINHYMFSEQCRQAINSFDFFGTHIYWSSTYSMETALAVLDDYRNRFPTKQIYITEACHNVRDKTPTQKGQEYITFWNRLKLRSNISGVTYYIASATDPIWGWDTGSGETWVGTAIPGVVGNRP
jgi:murein DD-endopeptidase MepM/ murein hydrolase activator NlpD